MAKNELATVTAELTDEYTKNGFHVEDVQLLESIASEINTLKRQTAQGIIEIGHRLNQVKDEIQHGSWQYYVEYRCSMSFDSAQRFMAAARAVSNFPQLGPVVSKITNTGMYVIGQNKNVTPQVIEQIVTLAGDGGEVTEREVRTIINSNMPDKAARKQALGFTPIDPIRARAMTQNIVNFTDQAYGAATRAGLNAKTVAKHKAYKDFAARIAKGNGETDLEKSITGLVYVAFVAQYSEENNDD